MAIDNSILRGVKGIIIGAADTRGLDDSINKAKAKGIPIVCVDAAIEHPWISSLVQTDNLNAAKLAGKYIVDNILPDRKKVLILGGTVGHQTGDARKNGVTEVCKAAGLTVIYRPADWDPSKAQEIVQNEINTHKDIGAIFGCWDPGVVAGIPVVKNSKQLDKIIMVGFDGLPMGLRAIEAGELNASVAQDTKKMGSVSVQLLIKVIEKANVKKFIPIKGIIIDKNNVKNYL
jgi:ribose transport system substrate-binding protein